MNQFLPPNLRRPSPKRQKAIRRKGWLGIAAGVGIVVVAVIGVGISRLNSLKPRVAEALTSAAGHPVTINGHIGLGWSLHPTIAVNDVSVANPPGFSRPDLAHIGAVDVRVSLLPLINHRLSIDSIAIHDPDILLERAADGQENWQPAPAAAPTSGETPAAQAGSRRKLAVSLARLTVTNGRLAYRDDKTGHVTALDLRQATLTENGPDAPANIQGQAVVNGMTIDADAQTGSLAMLEQPNGKPWPVSVTLTAAGAKLTAKGGIAQPLSGKGYALDVASNIPDLGALRPLAPHAGLPALHDVALTAHVADSGGPVPAISAVNFSTGRGDLAPLLPGVSLEQAKLSLGGLDQPVSAEARGAWKGSAFQATATLGSVSQFLTGEPAGAFPISLEASAGDNRLSMKGGVDDPSHLKGLDLAISGEAPDLAALSGLAGRPLPRLTHVTFSGQLSDLGALNKGIALTKAAFTSTQGDVRGDLLVTAGKPPAIKGSLTSDRLDLDALQTAVPAEQPATSAPAAPAPAPHTAGAPSGHLISDAPLPFASLRAVNADLRLTIGSLIVRGETWHYTTAVLLLDDGRLRLDPLRARLPAGMLDSTITADASQAAPPVSLRLNAPAVGLAPLLAMLGAPPVASGTANVQADLHGAGASPHAIAATLGGTASISMSGGQINTELLQKLAGPALARVNPAALLVHGGSTEVKCLAVRMTAEHGQARLDPIALNSGLISVGGSGTVNLGAETLDLHLRPQGRIGGTGFEVPLTVTGSFADPRATLNDTGAARAGVEAVIGILAGKKVPGMAEPAPISCGPANGPAGVQRAAPAAQAKPPNPAAILRQLLR